MESPKVGGMLPPKGLDMILQLLQADERSSEHEDQLNSPAACQLVTYDDLELTDESNVMAQEFLQSLAQSAATNNSKANTI